MKKIILVCSTLFALTANAQVKIGSNPSSINSNAHLDIEATTGSRFIVTKDSSKVGIGTLTPAAKLDVAGKVKITDGTQGNGKIFVSNASGVGSWVTPASALSGSVKDSTTASNGLTESTNNIKLGGTLSEATTIATSGSNTLAITGLQSGNLLTDSILVQTTTGVIRRLSMSALADKTVGSIAIFPYQSIPSGYLECNGQAVSRTTYADLFAKIGTTYGAGNGTTTFNIPDLRGEFVRGWDNGRGVDASRTLGSTQLETRIAENIGIFNNTSNVVTSAQLVLNPDNKTASSTYQSYTLGTSSWTSNFLGTQLLGVRPRNVSMVYAIKAVATFSISNSSSSSAGSTTEPWYSTATNTGATSNTENIYQLGNVGIGTNTPQSLLDVSPLSGSSAVVIGTRGTQGSDQASILFGSKYAGNNNFQSAGNLGWQFGVRGNSFSTTSVQNALHASYWNGTNWTEYMSWRNNGNVGIGITTPTAKLEVNGSISTILNAGIGSIRLSGGTANNSGIIEFYNSNSTTRAGYIGWANNGNLVYSAENGNKHYFTGGGGIYVQSASNYTVSNFAYYSNASYTTGTAGVKTGVASTTDYPYGIFCENRIMCVELNVASDKRTKNVIGLSNNTNDLNTLMQIPIKDYKMKDFLHFGNKSFKKVIAQEVEEVFPQAINYSSNFIPNIYQPATVILKGDDIEFLIEKELDLAKNDTLKVYFAGKEKQIVVSEVLSKSSFKAKKNDITDSMIQDVFVFGKYVHDFRAVDYEALTTLNISATQELYKKIKALESQVQKLNELEKDIQFIKASISNHLGK